MRSSGMTMANGSAEMVVEAALQKQEKDRRLLRIWLRVVLFTLFCLVLVGGATRLTESGLSITEWKPIHGAIPPLSVAEWEEEFQLYKRIPQYQEINKGMSLDEFAASLRRARGSSLASKCFAKCVRFPRMPGMAKATMLQRSSRRFSTGVPVSASR